MAAASHIPGEVVPPLRRQPVPFGCMALVLLTLAGHAPAVHAQPYAVFEVPDSLMAEALHRAAPGFENTWNALLVDELRATADSAPALRSLARRVASHEEAALGSRIAGDALALRDRWTADQRRLRVQAAGVESLATAAQNARDWERADSLFNRALADYRRIQEPRRTAWVLGSLGVVAFQSGDYARADSIYRLALEARRQLGDARMIGNTLNSFGVLHYLAGELGEANAWFDQARAVRERGGERGPLGSTLNYMGLVQRDLGHADSARTYFELALTSTVSAGDSARTAEVLANSVALLTDSGDHREALRRGERAVAIYRQLGNIRGEALLQINIGNLLGQQARFAEALEHLRSALELGRNARDVRGQLQTLLSMGLLGVTLRDPETGLPPLRDALALADSLEDPRARAAALNNLALLAEIDGDPNGAERHARSAVKSAVAAQDSALIRDAAQTIGGLALVRRDLPTARSWYERAAAGGEGARDARRAADLNNLGIVAIYQDSLEQAERLFRTAIAIAEEVNAPDLRWPPMLGLGEVAERRSDFARALAFDREAAALIDTLRGRQGEEAQSIALLSGRRLAADALVHLLTRLQPRFPDSAFVAEAFTWSERTRARALADLMSAPDRGARVALVDIGRVRAALPAKTAFLQFSLGDSSTSLWVVTRAGVRHFALPPRDLLRVRIEMLRRSLATAATAQSPAAFRASRALYRTLLEPAEGALKGVDHLVISPDGPLALVPFEALLVRDAPGDLPPPASSYLVHRRAVSYVPSASIWMALLGKARGGGVVGLGDPVFHGLADPGASRLANLPHTAEELAALERFSGARPLKLLRAAGATREALLSAPELSEAGIVHLATHGVASEFEPRRAGLWLAAGPDGTPGFVSVSDVLGLSLRADLVTLSACETGVGRVARGEGVLGLPRAVLAAGARSVLVSLWKVNDQSTAGLMTSFYRELLVRGRPAHEALAGAKRLMLQSEDTRSPYHWAPFVLIGRYPETP